MTSQPDNPRVLTQDVGPPWFRPYKLCERCWSMFETGSCIKLGEESAYEHPSFCGCELHRDGGRNSSKWDLWRVHHQSPDDLLSAFLSGCEFCRKLMHEAYGASDHLEDYQLELLRQIVPATCFSIRKCSSDSFWVRIEHRTWNTNEKGYCDYVAETLTESEDEEKVDQPFGWCSLESTFTGSQSCTELASYWLRDCLQNHVSCPRPPIDPWYPKRLLKISATHAYLIDTEAIKPKGPYATLSYCWGAETFEVLTRENLSNFEDGFPIDTFLPTFRDALYTASRLGIYYLWVDCFCIIQDSMDWEIESVKMLDVYSNSILNIGAVHAQGPKQGMFVTRKPDDLKRPRLRWQPTEHEKDTFFKPCRGEYSQLERLTKESGSLFDRGWVIQERLLSPRLLYFEDRQISWRCPSLPLAKETFPTAASMSIVRKESSYFIPEQSCALTTALWSEKSISYQESEKRGIWERTLRSYSQANLTYATDKLRAIRGVGDCIARHSNDIYLDGFFLKSLLKDLCFPILGRSGKHHAWRAPSWSWAAWDVQIDMTGIGFKPVYMYAACVTDLRGLTTLPSTLYCVGKLIPVLAKGNRMLPEGASNFGTHCIFDDPSNDIKPGIDFWFPIFSVNFSKLPPGLSGVDLSRIVFGILLRQIHDGSYCRVGYCQSHARNDELRSLLDVYNRHKPQLIVLI